MMQGRRLVTNFYMYSANSYIYLNQAWLGVAKTKNSLFVEQLVSISFH